MHSMDTKKCMIIVISALPLTPVAGLLVPLVVADAVAAEARTIAAIRDTNLRKAPTAESEILTLITKGRTVGVANCGKGWCRVSWNGHDGYVFAKNLGVDAPQWPLGAVVAWPGYDQKVRKITGAHEDSDSENAWVLELGGTGEWPLNGERPNFGGTIAAEIEPIENWLELEFGLSALGTSGHSELSGDVLFKKPFRLSPTVEFMIGGGPSLSRTLNGPDRGNVWRRNSPSIGCSGRPKMLAGTSSRRGA